MLYTTNSLIKYLCMCLFVVAIMIVTALLSYTPFTLPTGVEPV